MSESVIECVPNFSEGRDPAVIEAIAAAIRSVDGAKLLDVDPGKSTNRTVYTFAGSPSSVLEAAFQAAKIGKDLIDMRAHHGEHPRFGFLDVCPLIPISNCSMEDCVGWARELSKRFANELGMTIYNYGYAAATPERSDLSFVRSGEYEGLADKLSRPEWRPDFGPATFNERMGATAVGAREILIAYNINLNTTSVRRANSVAFDVREKGRLKRIGDPIVGEIVRDAEGNAVYEPGVLKKVKGIGWFIKEYGICQVSMNLTNLEETPLHIAFDETVEKAAARGIRVTGSELVGLIPLQSMLDAGRYFLHKQRRSSGVSDAELIKIAIRSLGLDELSPFDPKKKIIEYALEEGMDKRLVDLTVEGFVEETASESPAPGGGSIAATMGAMGAGLATMVANLSSHKRGWDERWEEFSNWAETGKSYYARLLKLIDEDTAAFDELMACFGLPKGSDEEKAARAEAIQSATKQAVEVPLEVMQVALESMEVIRAMAEIGNPNSVSDAGVGALAARSAVMGAALNVKINCGSIEDKAFVNSSLQRARTMSEQAGQLESEILKIVDQRIASL
ncbi:MAG TPA: glutamate formimidoyltransferase [Fimbriimonadaceae bacterium]|nr:glutamate formimidoyltransferase [Fimbriimonadaceae bacterium]